MHAKFPKDITTNPKDLIVFPLVLLKLYVAHIATDLKLYDIAQVQLMSNFFDVEVCISLLAFHYPSFMIIFQLTSKIFIV